MRITKPATRKDISLTIRKRMWFMIDDHSHTVRNGLRGWKRIKRGYNSVFGPVMTRAKQYSYLKLF